MLCLSFMVFAKTGTDRHVPSEHRSNRKWIGHGGVCNCTGLRLSHYVVLSATKLARFSDLWRCSFLANLLDMLISIMLYRFGHVDLLYMTGTLF